MAHLLITQIQNPDEQHPSSPPLQKQPPQQSQQSQQSAQVQAKTLPQKQQQQTPQKPPLKVEQLQHEKLPSCWSALISCLTCHCYQEIPPPPSIPPPPPSSDIPLVRLEVQQKEDDNNNNNNNETNNHENKIRENEAYEENRNQEEDPNFEPRIQYLLPELPKEFSGKKTLVLDLDETLVHSSFKPVPNADFIISIELDNEIHHVYVLKRPFVDQFLEVVGQKFEVVVFTASLAKYADPLLDILDIHKVVAARLFREACVQHYGNYVKDLSLLGRELQNTIIIDNSPYSYIFQPDNAIPITTWFNDPNDRQLLDLIPVLDSLVDVPNVVSVLQEQNQFQ